MTNIFFTAHVILPNTAVRIDNSSTEKEQVRNRTRIQRQSELNTSRPAMDPVLGRIFERS